MQSQERLWDCPLFSLKDKFALKKTGKKDTIRSGTNGLGRRFWHSMKKEMQLWLPQGECICYTLERKRVKNINLRVRPDGSVTVSAPLRVAEAEIERAVRAKAVFIQNARARFKRLPVPLLNEPCGADGEVLPFYDAPRAVTSCLGDANRADKTDKTVTLVLRQDTAQARAALMRVFLYEECARMLVPMCEAQLRRFCAQYPNFPLRELPKLRFCWMRSRWGSCRPSTAAITFNTRLLWYAPLCAEYVVVHELAHFLQPNHSAAFYAILDRMMPDWKLRKALLCGTN